MNTKITKTEKVRGYKAEFVIADGEAKGLRFNVEDFQICQMLN